MASQARKIYDVLRPEVGYKEGRDNWNKYAQQTIDAGVAPWDWNEQQWCQIFQSWGAWKSGLLKTHYPNTASCAEAVDWFRNRGRFSWYPAVGAQVFFGPDGGDHVEFVYAFDARNIYTIGGNTSASGNYNSDGVYLHTIARSSSRVYGYGVPAFTEGTISADPKWGGKGSGDVRDLGSSRPKDPNKINVYLEDLKPGNTNESVHHMQWALKAEVGLDFSSGPGVFGPKTQAAYAQWQRKLGYSGDDADGVPGPASIVALGKKYGWAVHL